MKLGCSKCRYSKTGCTRCNIDKARNAIAKKEAELNDPKISQTQRAKVEAQLNNVRGFLTDLEAAAGITSTKEAKTSSEQPPAKKQRQDQIVSPAKSNSVRHDIVTSPTPPRRLSPASAPIPQTVLLPQQQHQEEEGEEEVLGAATVAANVAVAANGMVGDVIERIAVSAPVDVATTSHDEDKPVAAAAAPLNTDQQKEEKQVDWWNPLDNDRLQQVKTALHVGSVTAGDIPLCREKQAENLKDWLNGCFTSGQGGSCYISGVPGTGKSLTTRAVLRSMAVSAAALRKPGNSNSIKNKQPALISVNCMTLTEPSQVIGHILSGWYAARARRSSNGGSSSAFLKSNEITDPIMYTPFSKEATTTATNNLRRMSSGGGACSSSSPLEELQSIVSASQSAVGCGGSGTSLTGNKGRRSSAGSSPQPFNNNNNNSKDQNNGGPMMVVILDELDSLLTGRTGDALIEDLFCLAHAEGSRLVLIGIANSIDLVQQLMKPGGSLHKRNLRPLHLIFPAYLRHQFSRVLNQRLSMLPGEVFEPNTLEFCARKMANGAGDMRRALEACSRALQNAVAEAVEKKERKIMLAEGGVEQQQQVQALVENSNTNIATTLATPAAPPPPPTTTTTITYNANPPRVGMRHMAAALSAITGGLGAENYNVKAIKQLPPQQQLLMCTAGKLMGETMSERGIQVKLPMIGGGSNRKRQMMGLVGSSRMVGTPTMAGGASSSLVVGNGVGGHTTNTVEKQPSSSKHIGEVTVGQLEEAHAMLCRQVGMAPYTPSEFGTAISNLEIAGLLSIDSSVGKGRNKDGKMLKVGLRIPEDDIVLALADVPVLKNVIGC